MLAGQGEPQGPSAARTGSRHPCTEPHLGAAAEGQRLSREPVDRRPDSLPFSDLLSIVYEMARREFLGGFELLVLLALIRLGDEAYGVPISEGIEQSSGRDVSLGSVYITLDRLEEKGLVSSRLGEPTAQRGGRAKTYFRITALGLREVRQAQRTLTALWRGVPQLRRDTA
jgi:PadR family transcriptional regulator PadR